MTRMANKTTSRPSGYIDAYEKLEALYPGYVLLYQTGTTVRAFGESARQVARHAGHPVTSAPPGSGYVHMVTFPEPLVHAVIARLLEAKQRAAYVSADGNVQRWPATATDLATRLKESLKLPHVRVMEVSESPTDFYISDFPDKAQAIDAVEALGGKIIARIVGNDSAITLKVRVPDAWLTMLPPSDNAAQSVPLTATASSDSSPAHVALLERLRSLEQERDRLADANVALQQRTDDLLRINEHQSRMLAEASAPSPTTLSLEVVTLPLSIHTPETRRAADRKLAEHLADGWALLDSAYSFDGSGAPMLHVVTLKRRREEADTPALDTRTAVAEPARTSTTEVVIDIPPLDDTDTQELPVTVPGKVRVPDAIFLDGGAAPESEQDACPRWLSDLTGGNDSLLASIRRDGVEATRDVLNQQVWGTFVDTLISTSASVSTKTEADPLESLQAWLARQKALRAGLTGGQSPDAPPAQ